MWQWVFTYLSTLQRPRHSGCTWNAAVRYTRGLFVAGAGKLPVSWLKSCRGIARSSAHQVFTQHVCCCSAGG